MRQSDGADLLGANNPRRTKIGLIYVAPGDDRQTVLTAIHTQDKLGRKQVAIVLPGENKAFQSAVDFDGLKGMQGNLKAQIVFITPSGYGPAEFARQRRFPVYSSLEEYAQVIQDEDLTGEDEDQVSKKGRGIGRKRPLPPPAAIQPSPAETAQPPALPILILALLLSKAPHPSYRLMRRRRQHLLPYRQLKITARGLLVEAVR